jgi:hypothetical protein
VLDDLDADDVVERRVFVRKAVVRVDAVTGDPVAPEALGVEIAASEDAAGFEGVPTPVMWSPRRRQKNPSPPPTSRSRLPAGSPAATRSSTFLFVST